LQIKKNGTTIFSTVPTIDNSESTTLTAATPSVISVTSFTRGDRITASITQVGDGTAKGIKFYLKGTQ